MSPSSPRTKALVGSSLRFSKPQALAIIQVLVDECGLRDTLDARGDVFRFLTAVAPGPEYRFMGSLGFGGKLFNANGGKLWVSCYTEHETPERRVAMARANARLDTLLSGWGLARPW
jgi:hypothetical protein